MGQNVTKLNNFFLLGYECSTCLGPFCFTVHICVWIGQISLAHKEQTTLLRNVEVKIKRTQEEKESEESQWQEQRRREKAEQVKKQAINTK